MPTCVRACVLCGGLYEASNGQYLVFAEASNIGPHGQAPCQYMPRGRGFDATTRRKFMDRSVLLSLRAEESWGARQATVVPVQLPDEMRECRRVRPIEPLAHSRRAWTGPAWCARKPMPTRVVAAGAQNIVFESPDDIAACLRREGSWRGGYSRDSRRGRVWGMVREVWETEEQAPPDGRTDRQTDTGRQRWWEIDGRWCSDRERMISLAWVPTVKKSDFSWPRR